MYPLYDLGYNDLRDADLLAMAAGKLGALVFDIRHAPYSRTPAWRKAALQARLGEAYRHIPALGNRNYKGGPIEIVDMDSGLQQIESALQTQPVILMCACWNREQCHRLMVLQAFESRAGVTSIPLDRDACKDLLGEDLPGKENDGHQLPLW